MRLFLRIGLIALQIVIFVVITGLAGYASSYLLAETYDQGLEPGGRFPVVAVEPRSAESSATQYRMIRWVALEETRRREPQLTYRLTAPEGRFTLATRKEFVPSVRFRVLESTNAGQLIEVVWADDDYETFAKYFTDGSSVQPRYLRVWGASNMFIGFIPGLIAAWLLGWLVRRRWLKDANASNPPKR